MRYQRIRYLAWSVLLLTVCDQPTKPSPNLSRKTIRFATFNVSLHRNAFGALSQDLEDEHDKQTQRIAEIVQRVQPDILLINEIDYDEHGLAAARFQDNYLGVSQNGQSLIDFPHRYVAPVNTGVPSGMDLNHDGKSDAPADAFGFGRYPGQYGMAVYSKYPIDRTHVRSFQKFLWKDMPSALLPVNPDDEQPFYSADQLALLRLSSKSHWDVPLRVSGHIIHFLVSHPTPPVFDGPEDRNGRRNHDEIRLWADYIDPAHSEYLYDDQGRSGGLARGARFVIAGDLNADPEDGGSTDRAARQLTEHPLVGNHILPTSSGGVEQSKRQGRNNKQHRGDPAHDTSDFRDNGPGNLRVDYVLPSRNLKVVEAGVYWPKSGEEGFDLVGASDHRLVWIDVELER